MPGISCAWLGEGEQAGRVGREKGVELQARLLPKPATFLHPKSQEMGGMWGRAFPDRNRHSEQNGGKIFKRAKKSRLRPCNTRSRGWLGLSCLCNDSKLNFCWLRSWASFNITQKGGRKRKRSFCGYWGSMQSSGVVTVSDVLFVSVEQFKSISNHLGLGSKSILNQNLN